MPRYFFDVHDGRSLPDGEGVELPDTPAVRREAVVSAGEIIKEAYHRLTGTEWNMKVRDAAGQVVMTLRFSITEP